MDQEEKVTDSRNEEQTAAAKREEAIRKVEEMLAQNRPNIDQGEINLNNSRSRAAALKRMNMPEHRDYGTELLESYHPPKPLTEMDSDEADAERKKAEALARVAAMMQQQQANDERLYGQIDRKRTRNRLQLRRPKESENSVDIQGFLSQYKLSPEAQERFAQIRFGVMKGIVRPALSTRLGTVVLPPMLLFTAWTLGMFPSMAVSKPIFILLALLLLPAAYYVHTWKLEFDAQTGLVKYHSLFHGTNLYEIQDLLAYTVDKTPDKPFPFSLLGTLDPRNYLIIRTLDHTINVPLKFSREFLGSAIELDGYECAGDLLSCLEQRTRELYRRQEAPAKAPAVSEPPAAEIPAAPETPVIPEKPKPAPEKPKPAPEKPKPAPEKPKPAPEKPKPAPLPDPVDLAKAREMFAKPAPSVFSAPERGSAFPDPTKSAFPDPAQGGFPDPAQKPKPDVDVDALFNQVLRDHGKL